MSIKGTNVTILQPSKEHFKNMMSSKRNQWKSAHFDGPNVAWNPCCAKLSYFEKQGKNSFRPNKNMECGGHIFCKKSHGMAY